MCMQQNEIGIEWRLGVLVLTSCNHFFCTKELLAVVSHITSFLLDSIWSFFCALPYVQCSSSVYVGVQQSRCQSLSQAQMLRGYRVEFSHHLVQGGATPHRSQGHLACSWQDKQSPSNGSFLAIDFRTENDTNLYAKLTLFVTSLHAPMFIKQWLHLTQLKLLVTVAHILGCPVFQAQSDNSLSLGLHDGSAIQMFKNMARLRAGATRAILIQPFALSRWNSTPVIPRTHTGLHRTGGYRACPHHLPHMPGFQAPAAASLWDPSSLISFNSPLKA